MLRLATDMILMPSGLAKKVNCSKNWLGSESLGEMVTSTPTFITLRG